MYEDNRYVVLISKCFNSNDPQLMVRNGNGVSALGLKKILFSNFYYVASKQVFNYCGKTSVFVFLYSSSVRFTLQKNKVAD